MLCKNVKRFDNILQMFVGNIVQQCFQDVFKTSHVKPLTVSK